MVREEGARLLAVIGRKNARRPGIEQ